MGRNNRRKRWGFGCSILAGLALPTSVGAQYVPIYGGATFNTATNTGYTGPNVTSHSAGNGMAAGQNSYLINNSGRGNRVVRWDSSGNLVEMANLGSTGTGSSEMRFSSMNSSGMVVGQAFKYSNGVAISFPAARWDASGAVTELDNLGTDANGRTTARANDINDNGISVGTAKKYVGGVDLGFRAVRWGVTGATELGNLELDPNGVFDGVAAAINSNGTAVGYVALRAVRWDATGTAATELAGGGFPSAISDSGMITGYSAFAHGNRAVRWGPTGTAVTVLDDIGLSSSGNAMNYGQDINNAGIVVGYGEKYVATVYKGMRAVRWNANGTAATELATLGNSNTGTGDGRAYAVNDAGIAIGHSSKYSATGVYLGQAAVAWTPDNTAVELNALIDPSSGWTNLDDGISISDGNWVTGIGRFDPDGPGTLPAYSRMFLMQLPEPGSSSLLACALFALSRRRMKSRLEP